MCQHVDRLRHPRKSKEKQIVKEEKTGIMKTKYHQVQQNAYRKSVTLPFPCLSFFISLINMSFFFTFAYVEPPSPYSDSTIPCYC
jgi:hypothetical protein